MPLKNKTSLFSLLVLQTSYVSNSENWHMSAEDVMGEDTFYSVSADSDIKLYLFKPEYTAEEMQWKEAAAALATQEDTDGGDHPEPELLTANSDWWCLSSNCPPMPKELNHSAAMNFSVGSFCWMLSPTPTPREPVFAVLCKDLGVGHQKLARNACPGTCRHCWHGSGSRKTQLSGSI